MIYTFRILFCLTIFNPVLFAQNNTDMEYHPPLGIPLILASNFGELRPNHFHMGLDFKTNSRTGYKIYSIEEGYVSRVKISPYGYGKAIYIDHPNGITSVYGHCSVFKGEIDSIVRAAQLRETNYAVEIFPEKNSIKIKKGQVIALSGNTGGSTGPHLHFEIRDTKTEHALNPLVFGFDIADKKTPVIRGIKLYALTKNGYRYPKKEISKPITKGSTGYGITGNQINVPANYCTTSGGIGLAFDVIDKLDGANNKCGLYGSYLIVDGDTVFGQRTDRIPFESTRYVNSHKDFKAYQTLRKKYHKCFRTRENDLPIYINNSIGVIPAKPGDRLNVTYIAYDTKGNTSSITFVINVLQGAAGNEKNFLSKSPYLFPDSTYYYESDDRQLEFGHGTVYEPCPIEYSKLQSVIAKGATPVNRSYRIKIKTTEKQDGKHYVSIVTNKGREKSLSIRYEDGWAVAESSYFGSYTLKRDETKPKLVPLSLPKNSNSTSATKLKWHIKDNQSGIEDYDLYIDGQWMLVEYDYKTDCITYTRPTNFKGEKSLLIKIADSCGNTTTWEAKVNFI